MFLFAHLGIGVRTIRWMENLLRKDSTVFLPLAPIFLGTLLPDLIDKPLYYGLSWLTGLRGAELGVIAGTRSFGHSWILLLLLIVLLRIRARQRVGIRPLALLFGVLSHLGLDLLDDLLRSHQVFPSTLTALVWPLLGPHFPPNPNANLLEHASRVTQPSLWIPEIAGSLCLWWEWLERKKSKRSIHN